MSVDGAVTFANFIDLTIYAVGNMTIKNMKSCERMCSKIGKKGKPSN